MTTDLDPIAHLDFEVKEEDAPHCHGFRLLRNYIEGDAIKEKTECPNVPKVMAVRSCCGMIEQLCLDCYNTICQFHATEKAKGKRVTHRGRHLISGKPFSQVQFL